MKTMERHEGFLQQMQEGLSIDKNELDDASMMHADLFHRVANRLELLISRRDAAKQTLTETEAEVDAQVRHDAQIADEKITEKEVESQKRLNKRVRQAMQELLELNHTVGQLKALKESYEQRSYMLRNLCDLYIGGYFGDASGVSNKFKNSDAATAKTAMNRMRKERL